MSLEIVRVLNDSDGDPNKEVVILRALTPGLDISNYGFEDNTYDKDKNISNLQRHFFQLPRLVLKNKGDSVCVFTGDKEGRRIIHDFSTSLHEVQNAFLNLKHCIWNNEGDKINLFRLQLLQQMAVKS